MPNSRCLHLLHTTSYISTDHIAKAQMTCELIGVAVTNAETMLSTAQHNFFHPQKSLCGSGHAVGQVGKSCVCGTKKAAVLKGCVSHWIFTRRRLYSLKHSRRDLRPSQLQLCIR